jgi:mannosyltransferase OCH1-like enzyme
MIRPMMHSIMNYKVIKSDETQLCELDKELKIPYPLKEKLNSIIPHNIFQTWHSKILPPLMIQSIKNIRMLNPYFKYYLFDDNDCRVFIRKHFRPDVLNAYDRLIPGAYKADLWRYCVLFIHGGIYLDIKYQPLNGFRFINLTEKEHLVSDTNNINIYNGFMVCLPRNELLFKAIRQIVDNVHNRFYGNCALQPTGPALLAKFVSIGEEIVDLTHTEINGDINYKIIYFNNIPILKSYHGHSLEKDKYSIKKHYSILWRQRQVYL